MMDKKLFAQLNLAYNKEPNETLYELWNSTLSDYEEKYIELTFKKIISNDKYMPSLNRFLEVLNSLEYIPLTEQEKLIKFEKINVIPKWVDKQFDSTIDEQTEELFADFNKFIEDIRNETI